MRRLMTLAVAALVAGGASVARADDPASVCAQFGEVSGKGGYWVYEPGETTIVYGTEVKFSGNSGSGFVTATQVTTPGRCVGHNKAGNAKGDEWAFEVGTATEIQLASVKVCQNVRGGGYTQTPESQELGAFECNP
jgi:plastocyanin